MQYYEKDDLIARFGSVGRAKDSISEEVTLMIQALKKGLGGTRYRRGVGCKERILSSGNR